MDGDASGAEHVPQPIGGAVDPEVAAESAAVLNIAAARDRELVGVEWEPHPVAAVALADGDHGAENRLRAGFRTTTVTPINSRNASERAR